MEEKSELRKLLWILAIALFFLIVVAGCNNEAQNGAATGAIIGAIAGGEEGAVVGAAIGYAIGSEKDKENISSEIEE
ncbi:MAG: hypothetical protein ACTSSP_08550, partial [Candidatus Asgardarchaeia archaeon]